MPENAKSTKKFKVTLAGVARWCVYNILTSRTMLLGSYLSLFHAVNFSKVPTIKALQCACAKQFKIGSFFVSLAPYREKRGRGEEPE